MSIGPGNAGAPVHDLRRRLVALGFELSAVDGDEFGPATEAALRRFQESRGLLATGRCDQLSWNTLVEAGYQLGDRLLYLRQPMMRGDDVLELQRRLDALGFDPQWRDGIFGPDTERALKDFQRNAGITVDGVGGPDVGIAFERLGARSGHDMSVAAVRERERLRRAPRRLRDRTVAVGDGGGLGTLANALVRRLTDAGATAIALDDPDPTAQARTANRFGAEVFVGLRVADDATIDVGFYSTDGFESTGGKQLAGCVAGELAPIFGPTPELRGLRMPLLRETRMPAVLCLLGPPAEVVARTATVAEALERAIEKWVLQPLE